MSDIRFPADTAPVTVADNDLLIVSDTSNAGAIKEATVSEVLSPHTDRTDNPHNVTKSQVGLGSVDNTSDANKPISNATQTAL